MDAASSRTRVLGQLVARAAGRRASSRHSLENSWPTGCQQRDSRARSDDRALSNRGARPGMAVNALFAARALLRVLFREADPYSIPARPKLGSRADPDAGDG